MEDRGKVTMEGNGEGSGVCEVCEHVWLVASEGKEGEVLGAGEAREGEEEGREGQVEVDL